MIITNIKLSSSYNSVSSDQIQQIASGLPITVNFNPNDYTLIASIVAEKHMTGSYRLSAYGAITGTNNLLLSFLKNGTQISMSDTSPGYFNFTQDYTDNINIGDKFDLYGTYQLTTGTNSITVNDFTLKYTNVMRPALYPMVNGCKSMILPGTSSNITIHVVDDTGTPVDTTDINLSVSEGTIDPSNGVTDTNGDFISTYTGPTIVNLPTIQIVASANKSGYVDGTGTGQITLAIPNIVAISITPNTTNCTEVCDISVDISWRNDGIVSGTFEPAIVVDGTRTGSGTIENLDPTIVFKNTFYVSGLMTGTHSICADPDSFPCPTITVYTPANIISTELIVDKNDCIIPCTVNGTVSWQNMGGTISSPINIGILVNDALTTLASGITIEPEATVSYDFQLPDLTPGTYNICASPDSGTNCQTIIVRAPNIVATSIIPSKTTCIESCDLTVSVKWKNTGDADGSFIPSIKIDGITLTPAQYSSEILTSGSSVTHTFVLTGLKEGSHTICADPDTFPCTTITVNKVVSAGFGSVSAIFLGGLLLGALFGKKCKDYKTIEECQKAGCEWKDGKCIERQTVHHMIR